MVLYHKVIGLVIFRRNKDVYEDILEECNHKINVSVRGRSIFIGERGQVYYNFG